MKRKNIQQILKNGDKITQTATDIVLSFGGKRKVLSTSSLCGGIHTELEAVFNHCDKDFETGRCEMYGNTYADHLCYVAKSIGLNPQKVSGLSTAADLSWASIAKEQFHEYEVTVICSGGVLHNGRRAGDTATMWEQDDIYHIEDQETKRISGTVNLLVHINACLSDGAMATALLVATEAKTATIRDRKCKSCYSEQYASGSGTDGVIVIGDMESNIKLFHANTDVKLGECIGKAVSNAVAEQLHLQMIYEEKYISPKSMSQEKAETFLSAYKYE